LIKALRPAAAPWNFAAARAVEHHMYALTVAPHHAKSIRLDQVADPPVSDGALLVETLALGICGTDREIIEGDYGWAPPDSDRLILGHEVLGTVVEAPEGSGFARGDHVAGIVRRPDPVPCPACAAGEWDMCRNGRYTERGIKERNGFGSERFRLEAEFAVNVDPQLGIAGVLTEPASVVAKGWDHIERIGARTRSWKPKTVLITGAGPVGLLAALFGMQRGLEVHVLDRMDHGLKPDLVRQLGGTYHHGSAGELKPDIVLECTGVPDVVLDVMKRCNSGGIVCLAGVSTGHDQHQFDVGGFDRAMVLQNEVVFGTVNANRRHFEMAADGLARADKAWLDRLITRRVPLSRWQQAFEPQPDDIKVVIAFGA
jgi:threonine dehydrogenase-like Zn-dependent dehydrogenase